MGEPSPAAAYRLIKRHTPLPRSRSVVAELTKIVDIKPLESIAVEDVELVVPAIRKALHPKPKAMAPVPPERDLIVAGETSGQVR